MTGKERIEIARMMSELRPRMLELYEQGLCSRQVADSLSLPIKRVQRYAQKWNMPRPKPHTAESFSATHRQDKIDKNGYVLRWVEKHPYAKRNHRKNEDLTKEHAGYVRLHRLVMEDHLGRYLYPFEVVHHIDGDKTNNSIENLELFSCNAEHLRRTLTGKCPNWSPEGKEKSRASVREYWRRYRESRHSHPSEDD